MHRTTTQVWRRPYPAVHGHVHAMSDILMLDTRSEIGMHRKIFSAG
jgi:hypothetical protein